MPKSCDIGVREQLDISMNLCANAKESWCRKVSIVFQAKVQNCSITLLKMKNCAAQSVHNSTNALQCVRNCSYCTNVRSFAAASGNCTKCSQLHKMFTTAQCVHNCTKNCTKCSQLHQYALFCSSFWLPTNADSES